jgi:hypothetical protein
MRLLRRRPRERGQAVVEFALILPIILFLVLGMTEMGFAISHDTSLVTATREGARVGAALRNGFNQCTSGDSVTSQGVDLQIIAATEGVIASPGSPVSLAQVQKIELIELDENGTPTGNSNVWLSSVTGGVPTGPAIPGTVPAQKLYFAPQAGGTWPAYKRCGSAPAHSIQVKVTYVYKFITPLGSLINALHGTLFGNSQITMTDQTSMALEPPTP